MNAGAGAGPIAAAPKSVYQGLFWSGINYGVTTLSAFLIFAALARLLGPADFGVIALALTATELATVFLPTGFADAVVQRRALNAEQTSSIFLLLLASSLLVWLALSALSPWLAGLLHAPALRFLVPLLGLRIVLSAVSAVPNALIGRALDYRIMTIRSALSAAIAGALGIIVAFMGYGVWGLVIYQLGSAGVAAAVTCAACGWRPQLRFQWRALKEIGHFGSFATGNNMIACADRRADQLIVGAFLGVTGVGLLNFAKRIEELLSGVLSGVVQPVAYPHFSRHQADPDRLRALFLRATRYCAAIGFPVYLGMMCIAPKLIPLLFGPQWVPAIPIIQLLVLLGLIKTIGAVQSAIVIGSGRASWWFYYALGHTLLGLGAIACAARFGVLYVAMAVVLRSLATFPVALGLVARLLKFSWLDYGKGLCAPAFAGLVMVAGVSVLQIKLGPGIPDALSLAVSIPAGAVLYVTTFWLCARESSRLLSQDIVRILRRA